MTVVSQRNTMFPREINVEYLHSCDIQLLLNRPQFEQSEYLIIGRLSGNENTSKASFANTVHTKGLQSVNGDSKLKRHVGELNGLRV